jgi:hypothetical protein
MFPSNKMSVYTTGSTNFMGASTPSAPTASALGASAHEFGDAPLRDRKDIPKNYAVANWVLTRALQDDIALPTADLFRFNLGRSNPFPLLVNARSQCFLNGSKAAGIPPSQFYCPGCGPNPYTPARYAFNA